MFAEPTDEAAAISPGSLRKQLNIGNTVGLERSVKRELQQEGLLDGPSDVSDDDDDNDEVLAELHRKQKELRALSAANLATTRQLYKLAQEEMARQETRRKLVAADAEVRWRDRKRDASLAVRHKYVSYTCTDHVLPLCTLGDRSLQTVDAKSH